MRSSNAKKWNKSQINRASSVVPRGESTTEIPPVPALPNIEDDDDLLAENTSVRIAASYAQSHAMQTASVGNSVPPPPKHEQETSSPTPTLSPPPQARTTQAKKRRDTSTDSVLSRYFREMAVHQVMSADDEVRAAKGVQDAEVAYWVTMLSYIPAAGYVLDLLEQLIEQTPPREPLDLSAIADLRAFGDLYRKQRSKLTPRQEKAYRRACESLAETIRLPDTDRLWTHACTQLAREMAGPSEEGPMPRTRPLIADTPSYRKYIRRMRKAYLRQLSIKSSFVRSNLRLVVSIARRYNRGRMPLNDLIQEGNIGLMKAVERFDYRRGYRFSTYASWWIRHSISRALADKGRAVRIPVHMLDTYNRVTKATQNVLSKTGRPPTLAELSKETGIPEEKLAKVKDFTAETPFSLDHPVGDEDGRRFIDFLQEDDALSPFDHLANRDWAAEVRRLLSTLTEIEAHIIRLRFGLDDENELTLKQIGDRYHLSRERIRQLQEQALGKIRKQLRDY